MAIEFRCPSCEKKLRTADDRAGRTAKCPQCGTAVQVPAAPEIDEFGDDFGEEGFGGALPPRRAGAARSSAEVVCPLCGASNSPDAARCLSCGEELGAVSSPAGAGGSARFEAGDMLSKGWELFQANMGVYVAVTLLYLFIPVVINQVFSFGLQILMGGIQAGGAGQEAVIALTAVGFLVTVILGFLIQTYFDAGYTLVLLNAVRRKPVLVGDLFAGGPFLLPLAINRLVFGLANLLLALPAAAAFLSIPALGAPQDAMVIVGAVLGLLGACGVMWLWVVFWPYCWLAIDRNPGGLGPLKQAAELTQGYRGQIALMGLLYWLVFLAGYLACCIGIIFTLPIANLMVAVGYQRILRSHGAAA